MDHPKVLGIILARGGSKRLPNKNVKLMAGKPLIAYTVEAALKANFLDRVIVSTDDLGIREVTSLYGAEAPFLRPAELATDEITAYPALIHAITWLEDHEGYRPEYVMALQATSPLRTSEDIDNSIALFSKKNANGVVSLCETKHHPYWTMRVAEDGTATDFISWDKDYSRFQDLPPAYARNGAIFLTKRQHLLEQHTFYKPPVYPYVMPTDRSIDIDTEWDFLIAELILQNRRVT